jgi:hypothetical protein
MCLISQKFGYNWYSMYEVLCEQCWHTEAVDGGSMPDHPCPNCDAEGSWVGPFAQASRQFSRRESWPVLTSPHYAHAGQVDRRINPR